MFANLSYMLRDWMERLSYAGHDQEIMLDMDGDLNMVNRIRGNMQNMDGGNMQDIDVLVSVPGMSVANMPDMDMQLNMPDMQGRGLRETACTGEYNP